MSTYTDAVDITPYRTPAGAWEWKLDTDLHWEIGKIGSGLFVIAPAGFITDLASIPKLARWLFNPDDPSTAKAAIVHDNLLFNGFGQQMAVGEFYAALKADGVARWRRIVYYLAVTVAIDVW